jgi:hypothetical protein
MLCPYEGKGGRGKGGAKTQTQNEKGEGGYSTVAWTAVGGWGSR